MTGAPIILLTRDAGQSQKFSTELGPSVRVEISPLFETRWLNCSFNPQVDYLVFTSANGVSAADRFLKLDGMPAFAVGQRTGQIAEEAGYNVTVADGSAENLAQSLAVHAPSGRGLWVHGEEVAVDLLAHPLTEELNLTGITAYRRDPMPLNETATELLHGENTLILPLFSPAAARQLGSEFRRLNATAPFEIVAISDNCADAWQGPPAANVEVATEPNAKEMVRAVQERLKTNLVGSQRG